MKPKKTKIIGVLGGMGPESTAIFYQSLIKECQQQYGAQFDEDYPEMFIYNLPIPDIVKGLGDEGIVLASLVKGVKKIESIGVDFVVMPCNTATYFYNNLKKEISIPFLSIIGETAKKVKSKGYSKIGLLATKTTIENKIYENEIKEAGLEFIVPEELEEVNKIILNILSGKKLESDKEKLKEIISKLQANGAEAIVIGCTDIPILLKQKDVEIELFDTVEILAESTIKFATA